MLQTEKPMCSERMENERFLRATRAPVASQNAVSSGRQSSIQWRRSRPAGGFRSERRRCWGVVTVAATGLLGRTRGGWAGPGCWPGLPTVT